MITAALIGNPNCGKTALFNALTGQQQYVGNWAGVTVEKKEGTFSANGETVRLIDLPGIYSLYPYSIEEKITKSYLEQQPPDVIINILDGTCPEKSLYLTLQLCELHLPMLIAVNMSDELEKRGVHIDYADLAQELGVGALPISAKKKTGLEELKRQLFHCMGKTPKTENLIRALPSVREVLRISGSFCPDNAPAFASDILSSCGDTAALPEDGRVRRELLSFISSLASVYGDSFAALAHDRYEYIGLLIKRYFNGDPSEPLTDRLDRLVLNRFWAFPLLLAVLLSVFFIVFGAPGRYLGELLSNAVNIHLAGLISAALSGMNAPVWLCRLVSQGLLGGVSAVLAFLPQLSLLYLFLTLLEDSGLMARAAFLADGPMRGIGMSGKAFIPMLMGFGCTVPAVFAARTVSSQQEKTATVLLAPFMSCCARMPIYALFAGTFFPLSGGFVSAGIYILGVAAAVIYGAILRKTVLRGGSAPFLLELPPYRIPDIRTLFLHLWQKCRSFILRTGTLIACLSVIIWTLNAFTPAFVPASEPAESLLARAGALIAPLLAPLGFGTWQAAVSLLSGIAAKESVISCLTVVYAAGAPEALPAIISGCFTPASSVSFMVFCLLYSPCIAACAAMKKELGSAAFAAAAALFQTLTAYAVSFAVYRLLLLF